MNTKAPDDVRSLTIEVLRLMAGPLIQFVHARANKARRQERVEDQKRWEAASAALQEALRLCLLAATDESG